MNGDERKDNLIADEITDGNGICKSEPFGEHSIEHFAAKIRGAFSLEEAQRIEKAYRYAEKWHYGVTRDSGEPYILHPVAVAEILLDIGMDCASICTALLHDVLEDTQAPEAEMVELFGAEVVGMVKGLTKTKIKVPQDAPMDVRDATQAENMRKLLLAVAGDVRVVIIKLADRLHNMRTLNCLSEERQKRISQETLYCFAPLAARLGIMQIKGELEDLSFRYLYPEEFKKVYEQAALKTEQWKGTLQKVENKLRRTLDDMRFSYQLSSRRKHYYSIYKKMLKNNCGFDDIYDFMAIRIIIDIRDDEKEPVTQEMRDNLAAYQAAMNERQAENAKGGKKEYKLEITDAMRADVKAIAAAEKKDEEKRITRCYEVIGAIHRMWSLMSGRFKDYIGMPKANHYSSLHTTVFSDDGLPFEIQVRTVEMHKIAEYGIAAHWKYKDGKTNSDLDSKLEWFRKTMDEEKEDNSKEFMEAIKTNLFTEDVFVYTPVGKVMHLPMGSTIIDFAYAIHSEVGNQCSGAFINNKFVPITTVLQNGDIVKVQTLGKHPSLDWLKFAKSSGARSKIKQYFKKANREEYVHHGKELLDAESKKRRYQLKDLATEERILEVMEKHSFATEDDLYAAIGNGSVKAENVINFFITRLTEELKNENPSATSSPTERVESGILINGEANLLTRRAKCCKPLPGDEIVGYISRGRGITVHRKDCACTRSSEQDRFIPAEWGSKQTGVFSSDLVIKAKDSKGLTADICAKLYAAKNVRLTEITARVEQNEATIFITVEVENLTRLTEIKKEISQVKGVYSVERV